MRQAGVRHQHVTCLCHYLQRLADDQLTQRRHALPPQQVHRVRVACSLRHEGVAAGEHNQIPAEFFRNLLQVHPYQRVERLHAAVDAGAVDVPGARPSWLRQVHVQSVTQMQWDNMLAYVRVMPLSKQP